MNQNNRKVRRAVAASALIAMGLGLSGCDTLMSGMRAPMRPVQLVDYNLSLSYVDVQTNQIVQSGSATSPALGAQPSAFSNRYVPVIDPEILRYASETSQNRDFVQDALMQRSDVLCEAFIDDLYVRVTHRKLFLGEVAMVASAVGAFTGGEAAQALNLVSAIAQGSDTLADSALMQNQLVTLIANQIQANRTRIRDQIVSKRTDGLTKYPLALALRDAQAYHQSCSFMSGISSLSVTSNKADITAANAVSTTVIDKAKIQ
ncbi:hypothetical protein [Xanthobacter versatilis]|uniref:Lipoprotein n=1 Tax=Xanthobacter autotrophicus (strain ATCC BAA-1158 / Py2) TaxID=78245 RepID=A7IIZ0_XANP2|nr:hypothetical protein Xaut_2743 [Xanthobacter autotrophicus Py2]